MYGVERLERPLNAAEKRWLRLHLLRRDRPDFSLRRTVIRSAIVFGPLWLLTMIVASGDRVIATFFWIALAIVINVYVAGGASSRDSQLREAVLATLDHDRVTEVRVRCRDLLRIAELEDCGDCWLLDVGDEGTLVLQGQQYYEDTRFPSSDFSIVEIHQSEKRKFKWLILSRAPKLNPRRTFPESAVEVLVDMEPADSFFTTRRSLTELEAILDGEPTDGRYR